MPPQTLESRIVDLEKRVTRLEELPARIDDLTSQVSQLRTEMRAEFSAVRHEFTAALGEMGGQISGLGTQMRVLHEDVIGRIALLHDGLSGTPKRRSRQVWEISRPFAGATPMRFGISNHRVSVTTNSRCRTSPRSPTWRLPIFIWN